MSFIVQENIDILVIGESKLNKSHTTAQLQLPGFNEPFRLDSVNCKQEEDLYWSFQSSLFWFSILSKWIV